MTIELDIYRSAMALIKASGSGALVQAAVKAKDMLQSGDLQGQVIWMKVYAAIGDLLAHKPSGQIIH